MPNDAQQDPLRILVGDATIGWDEAYRQCKLKQGQWNGNWADV